MTTGQKKINSCQHWKISTHQRPVNWVNAMQLKNSARTSAARHSPLSDSSARWLYVGTTFRCCWDERCREVGVCWVVRKQRHWNHQSAHHYYAQLCFLVLSWQFELIHIFPITCHITFRCSTPVLHYSAWGTGVNNQPRAVTQQCLDWVKLTTSWWQVQCPITEPARHPFNKDRDKYSQLLTSSK